MKTRLSTSWIRHKAICNTGSEDDLEKYRLILANLSNSLSFQRYSPQFRKVIVELCWNVGSIWFEPRSISSLYGMIVQVGLVPKKNCCW